MRRGHAAVTALLAMVTTVAAHAGGEEVEDGAALHAAWCTRCHDSGVYTRDPRLVNNRAELVARVRQCELMAGAGWFDEEVAAVVDYLEREYYGFRR